MGPGGGAEGHDTAYPVIINRERKRERERLREKEIMLNDTGHNK